MASKEGAPTGAPTSPAENAATVREALDHWEPRYFSQDYIHTKYVALDALLAQAEAGADGRLDWYRNTHRELVAERDAAVRERDQAREALRYYADPASWRQLETMGTASANLDRGSRARAALTGEGTE